MLYDAQNASDHAKHVSIQTTLDAIDSNNDNNSNNPSTSTKIKNCDPKVALKDISNVSVQKPSATHLMQ